MKSIPTPMRRGETQRRRAALALLAILLVVSAGCDWELNAYRALAVAQSSYDSYWRAAVQLHEAGVMSDEIYARSRAIAFRISTLGSKTTDLLVAYQKIKRADARAQIDTALAELPGLIAALTAIVTNMARAPAQPGGGAALERGLSAILIGGGVGGGGRGGWGAGCPPLCWGGVWRRLRRGSIGWPRWRRRDEPGNHHSRDSSRHRRGRAGLCRLRAGQRPPADARRMAGAAKSVEDPGRDRGRSEGAAFAFARGFGESRAITSYPYTPTTKAGRRPAKDGEMKFRGERKPEAGMSGAAPRVHTPLDEAGRRRPNEARC